jgi:WD40 repeat protein
MSSNDEIRKKRVEEIELKKKRLEEMRKLRSVTEEKAVLPASSVRKVDPDSVSNDSNIASILTAVLSSNDIDERNENLESNINRKYKYFSYSRSDVIMVHPRERIVYEQSSQTDNMDVFQEPVEDRKVVIDESSTKPDGTMMEAEQLHSNRTYSESQKLLLLQDSSFLPFLRESSLKLEREMEFLASFNNMRNFQQTDSFKDGVENKLIVLSERFEEESLRNRSVIYMAANKQVQKLFLTCHGTSKLESKDGDGQLLETGSPGLVCVWSKDLHKRPEMKFFAPSLVLTAVFCPDSNLIVGGCQNGQLVIWEMTCLKPFPMQKSSLVGKGHKYPVISVSWNMNELVSVSTEGTICYWDISRLTEPIHVVNLTLSSSNTQKNQRDPGFLFSPQVDKDLLHGLPCISAVETAYVDTKFYIFLGTATGQLLQVPATQRSNELNPTKVSLLLLFM